MKLKTHQATSKRMKITGNGKIQQTNIKHQHLRHRKTKRMLKNAKGDQIVENVNLKKIKRLLPYL